MKLTTRMMIPAVAFSVVVGASSLAAQVPAPAQEQQREQPREQQQAARTAEGELLRVDAENKMFAIRSAATNQEQQFKYTDDTEVTGERRNIEGLATMAGAKVKVEYKTEGTSAVATKIDIQPRAETPAPPPARTPAPVPAPEPGPAQP